MSRREKDYEYYINLNNVKKEVCIPYKDEHLNLYLYKVNFKNLKKIYSILYKYYKLFKYTGQSDETSVISNFFGYLHELKKSKKNSILGDSYITIDNKSSKINNLHADSYNTENLPYRIFEDYCKNFLRFKTFKIIKNDNYKYLIGVINKGFGMEIYQVLNYWHVEEEKITYKKNIFLSYNFGIKVFLKKFRYILAILLNDYFYEFEFPL